MRNKLENVPTKSSLAFGNTPVARNATTDWYWANQFSGDLLLILGQLDWRCLQILSVALSKSIKDDSADTNKVIHMTRALANVGALSSFLKEHEGLIQEWNSISSEIIAVHHINIELMNRKTLNHKGNVRKPKISRRKNRSTNAA